MNLSTDARRDTLDRCIRLQYFSSCRAQCASSTATRLKTFGASFRCPARRGVLRRPAIPVQHPVHRASLPRGLLLIAILAPHPSHCDPGRRPPGFTPGAWASQTLQPSYGQIHACCRAFEARRVHRKTAPTTRPESEVPAKVEVRHIMPILHVKATEVLIDTPREDYVQRHRPRCMLVHSPEEARWLPLRQVRSLQQPGSSHCE